MPLFIDFSDGLFRWFLACAGCPALAGTLCVMAIMFNICALCQGWHEIIDGGGSRRIISQPAWIIALKAISLALAATGYLLSLLTMRSKRSPVRGFTISIIAWLISAAILFSLIGIVVGEHPAVQRGQFVEYTQNFFYGIFAAGIYILVAGLMAIYVASAHLAQLCYKDRRTVECTSIILRATTFAVFLVGGAAVYSTIEGWSLMDALYFTDYTILTIGIGNIAPKTHLGRSLLFPYATGGIVSLGLIISSMLLFIKDTRNMRLRFKLKEARVDIHEQEGSAGPNSNTYNGHDSQSFHRLAGHQFPGRSEVTKLYQAKSNFYRRHQWQGFLFFLVAWFILWFASAGVFRRSERSQDWSYFAALYFTYTSITTIGYGDLYPTSNFGKVFFVFWSLLAIPVLTNLITSIGEIGLTTLVTFCMYVWGLCISRIHKRRSHQDGIGAQHHGGSTGNRPTRGPSHLESQLGDTNFRRRDQEQSSAGHSFNDLRVGEGSISQSSNEAARHKLLLTGEIKRLLSALRDSSIVQEPSREWATVLSLLHADEDEGSSSLEPILSPVWRHPVSPANVAAERNLEVLWMLNLLVEKLYSDLREEL